MLRSGTATPEVALDMDDVAYSGSKEQVTFTCTSVFALIDFYANCLLCGSQQRIDASISVTVQKSV